MFLHSWFMGIDFRLLLMFKSSRIKQLGESARVFPPRDNLRRHLCRTCLADARLAALAEIGGGSKSKHSVDLSWLPIHAAGSTTKAIAFACRICDSHSFRSCSEKQHKKTVRVASFGDSDFLTIFMQYLVCLSGSSSMYSEMSLKKMSSLGAFSFDSCSVR